MKRILIAGCIIAGLIACNNNTSAPDSSGNKDSGYNSPATTDTGQALPNGTDTTAHTNGDTTRR